MTKYSSEFKAKVANEYFQGDITYQALAKKGGRNKSATTGSMIDTSGGVHLVGGHRLHNCRGIIHFWCAWIVTRMLGDQLYGYSSN
ncbi:transposase [Lacticaseibacillus pantheris]|uniref:transposase n=1 Tax=Lacticaseibacillus pantheris TaxID=171523 RepID=UPI002657BF83|nr:transposase [Lacticaseibacillus pantheris]WKF85056.1 transposase [Lacticaseibacillus pantheris]